MSIDYTTDLEASDPSLLSDGQRLHVSGYRSFNDGGDGVFSWDEASTEQHNGGTVVKASSLATGRFRRVYGPGGVSVKWFGAIGDGVTDDTDAVQAAIDAVESDGGGVVIMDGDNFLISGQLTIDASGVTISGVSRGRTNVRMTFTYLAGPAVVLGNTVSQRNDIAFVDIELVGLTGQEMFLSRWIRGLHFVNCKFTADRFVTLGDKNNASAATYVFDLYDCEGFHVASPTKHFIAAENFQGQLDFRNTFIEGQHHASLDGFYASDNIQQRIDHITVSGGYFSRFRDNWSFVDARVVNAFFSGMQNEGAGRNCFRFEVTSSTSKNIANVGWENVTISNQHVGSTGYSIYAKNDRASSGATKMVLSGITVLSDGATEGILYAEGGAGDIQHLHADGIYGTTIPSGAGRYAIQLAGNCYNATVKNVLVNGVIAQPFAALVRIEASVLSALYVGMVGGSHATLKVDDQGARASVAPTNIFKKVLTIGFGTVSGGDTASDSTTITGGPGTTSSVHVTPLDVVDDVLVFKGRISSTGICDVTCINPSGSPIVVGDVSVLVSVSEWL